MPDNSNHSLSVTKSGDSRPGMSSATSSTGTACTNKDAHSLNERYHHNAILGSEWTPGRQDPNWEQEMREWENSLKQHNHAESQEQGQAPQDHREKSSPETSPLKDQGKIAKPNVDETIGKALPKES
jgi:hypothetical protein